MEIILLVTGLIIGAIAAGFVFYFKSKSEKGISQIEFDEINGQLNSSKIDLSKWQERNKSIEENFKKASDELSCERTKVLELSSAASSLKQINKNLEQRLVEQKAELEQIHQKLNKDFEILANKILEEKSSKFTLQNKENIDSILNPLNEKIKEFQKRVEETYDKEAQQRFSLKTEITRLYELNVQMTKEANNLTQALKGQTKTQGNWGEMILENILEKSGLVKGREYAVQASMNDESGRRLQPDIIINLPENKSLIIDSKCSLTAYEKYCSGETDEERITALKEHIGSIRRHIKGLGEKSYQNIYQITSLDFVLMFLPIEPAFSLAVQNDLGLFNEAFDKNIVIVSPSTLLATLRTIASIWRQENQNRNALEIARQGGALYDKFQGLISDLIDIGKKMKSTQDTYEDAMKKLYTGRGNLVGSVEKLKNLGAKTTKSLPQSLLERIEEEDEAPRNQLDISFPKKRETNPE
ncbi:MAG: DNA recombination protein RmuC [Ignavibacteriaceae bacterium]